MNNYKDEKNYTFKQVSVVIIIFSIIVIIFGAKGFYHWAEKLKNEQARNYMIGLTKPIYNFSSSLKLDIPMDKIREIFLSLSKNLGKIDLLSFNVNSNQTVFQNTNTQPEIQEVSLIKKPQHKIKEIKILLIGDSMAASIAYAFIKVLRGEPKLKHIKLIPVWRISSTLSAPQYGNWPIEIKKLLEKNKYDLTLIILGSNDAQHIYTPKRNFYYGTEQWKNEHKRRVCEFIQTITKTESKVYWIDVPPMRLKGYKDMMVEINSLYHNILKEIKNTRHIVTTKILGDSNGLYSTNLKINNRFVRVREGDGIHLTIEGAQLVVDSILKNIDDDFKQK